jgi:hypothetical protein
MLLYLLLHMPPMHDPAHRFPLLAVVSCGLLNVALLPSNSSVSGLWHYSNGLVVWNLLQRLGFALDVVGNRLRALVLALRLTAIRTALPRKLAYIGLVSAHGVAVAGTREPCDEARWNVARRRQTEV